MVRWPVGVAAAGSWLAPMLARKPRMLVTTALANKMARIVWALLVKGGTYRLRPWRRKPTATTEA